MHPLDRPAWTALTTRQSPLALGGDRARRFDPAIVPFAATVDDDADSLAALAALVGADETIVMLQASAIMLPDRLAAVMAADAVQMIATRPVERIADPRIERLTQADAAEMLALATLTRPGPFTLRAQDLGPFWGIRSGGRLVAMAGTRMAVPRFTELSGLCTHPEFQGQGLGRLMLRFVAGEIAAAGDTPMLHAYASNVRAIALYESIGFELRSAMHVAMVQRAVAYAGGGRG